VIFLKEEGRGFSGRAFFTGMLLGVAGALLAGLGARELAHRHPSLVNRLFRQAYEGARQFEPRPVDVKELTINEMVGQLIFSTGIPRDAAPGFVYLPFDATRDATAGLNVVYDRGKAVGFVNAIREAESAVPIFIGDEGEGGYVKRIETGLPPARVLGGFYEGKPIEPMKYPEWSDGFAKQRGDRIRGAFAAAAAALRNNGVDFVLAPCLDVALEQGSEIAKNHRAFSDDEATVAALGEMYIDAMHGRGIKVVAKHFLGAGGVEGDPHNELLRVPKNKEAFSKSLHPFKALIEKGKIDAIMLTHVINENIDEGNPVSLSPRAIRMLRGLGFRGPIIVDDLDMKPIEKRFEAYGEDWLVEAAIAALKAGANGIIVKRPDDSRRVIEGIAAAIAGGDGELERAVENSFYLLAGLKGIYVRGGAPLSDLTESGRRWIPRRVRRGETLYNYLEAEDSPLVRKKDGTVYLLRENPELQRVVSDFCAINGIGCDGPPELQSGRVYRFPDLNGDGHVGPNGRGARERSEAGRPIGRAAVPKGKSFCDYLLGEGVTKKCTKNVAKKFWGHFMEDNPGVKGMTLLKGRRYIFRDYNRNGRIDFERRGRQGRRWVH